MGKFTPSSRTNPCKVCGRTKDGDCRMLSDGLILCHSTLNGVKPGEHHATKPFIYCGYSDEAQGFGMWLPEELAKDRPQKAPREPKRHEFTYHRWDGTEAPQKRLRIDYPDGRDKKVTWAGTLGGLPEASIAPYRWFQALDHLNQNPDAPLFVLKGELKADLLWQNGHAAISALGASERLIAELRHLGSRVVLAPDCDLKDLELWYRQLTNALPECRHLLAPMKGLNWRQPPDDGGLGIEDWIGSSNPDPALLAAAITAEPWQPSAEPGAEPKGEAQGVDPLDEWEALLSRLVDPKHPLFERNTVRRQIRAATAAAEATLRVSPQQVRSRLIAKQRELITGTTSKGTAGGQKVKAPKKEWLIANLIPLRCLTAIAAFAKVGKTKFICAVAASLIHQRPLMGNAEWQPAPGPHKLILWLTDQPAADTNGYLQAVGLQEPDGTLHPSIVKLYTEEDDLAWDDQGIDQLLEDITANPGAILITDSFYANVQRPYGSDQEPEAGGALIDIQTLLSQSGTTHLCCFHSTKDTGLTGVNAIRGHSSAAGVPSAVISLHFLERKDPSGNGKWVADKDNPYRRMVVEGRAPYRDLLVRLDGEAGIWSCHGDYTTGIGQLAQGQQVEELPALTQNQRGVLDVIGAKPGLAVKQIAYEWKGREPSKGDVEQCRKAIASLMRKRLVSERPTKQGSVYAVRQPLTKNTPAQAGDPGETQAQPGFSGVENMGGGWVEGVMTHQEPLMNATHVTHASPIDGTHEIPDGERAAPKSPIQEGSAHVRSESPSSPVSPVSRIESPAIDIDDLPF